MTAKNKNGSLYTDTKELLKTLNYSVRYKKMKKPAISNQQIQDTGNSPFLFPLNKGGLRGLFPPHNAPCNPPSSPLNLRGEQRGVTVGGRGSYEVGIKGGHPASSYSPLTKGVRGLSVSFLLHRASFILLLLALLLLPSLAVATMQNYCLIPPYVMRGGVPPNIMIAYEKGGEIEKRAFKGTAYSSATSYFGFFESNANYTYNAAATLFGVTGYFEKSLCTPAAGTNCYSGNILNWALMSSLDLSSKVLIGFGWPKLSGQGDAGDVFTYLSDLVSYGQWDDVSGAACVSGVHDGITYSFSLTKNTGSSPSTVEIRSETSTCSGGTLIVSGAKIGVKLQNPANMSDATNIEKRLGLIQKLADKDMNGVYDADSARFGIKRWQASTASVDRNRDILCDASGGNCTSTDKSTLIKGLLNAISREPGKDGATPLGTMMKDITQYFNGQSSTYEDKDNATTQSPYSWATDPLRACRKSFTLYMTTGADLSGTLFSPMPAACSSLTFPNEAPYTTAGIAGDSVTDPFLRNACAAFNTDFYTADGTPPRQNISNFVVHTTFYGGATSTVTKAKLQYAANISDGLYYEADKPEELLAALERAVLEMLRRASSGTAASVLASGEGSGANLVQVIFYPETPRVPLGMFDRRASWLGRLTNYWYYVDPLFASSTILDDSGTEPTDRILNLSNDKKVTFRFSHADDATMADRYNFGSTTLINTIRFERTKNLWDAGVELWKRDVTVGSGTRDKRKIYTTINGTSFLAGNFSQDAVNADSDNAAALQSWLNLTTVAAGDDLNSNGAVTVDDARVLIRYIHGEDFTALSLRQRTVAVDLNGDGDTADAGEGAKVWKLGDVLNSTPKILSWIPLNTYHQKYSDATYGSGTTGGYINTANYKNRGMIFVGGNDGMLHAVKLGTLELVNDPATPSIKARLTGSDLGKEMWAFIPKNVLPYLKYLTEIEYCHTYTVDLTPYIVDASINKPAACGAGTDYWDCPKQTKCGTNAECAAGNNTLDMANTSWRTILIGGMRYGGACRNSTGSCNNSVCSKTTGTACTTNAHCPSGETCMPNCVKTPVAGNGYSSYFALDVTDQNNPQLLWEFSNENLGFTTTGPAIVKINGRKADPNDNTKSIADKDKNGRWFVVFGSGPTGPNTGSPDYQFMGRSDQNLRLFVLDLKTGSLVRTIDAKDASNNDITNAFAGSMLNTTIDTDSVPDYQDDVVYIPYVKMTGTSPNLSWTNGGIGRLVTKEDLNGNDISATGNTALNPANWAWSVVMDNIGPVTSSVAHLINKNRGELWLYFGTGRYYFEQGVNTDDAIGQRQIFGMKEPCYSTSGFNSACTTPRSFCATPTTSNPCGELTNVTNIANVPSDPAAAGYHGWYINLDVPGNYTYTEAGTNVTRNYRAERIITDPLTTTTGLVFFTAYKPYFDICAYGGKSFIWATKYDTGGAPGALLKGMALVQVSTGAIEQIDLSKAFTLADGRKSGALEGVPPTAQGLSIMSTPPPVKRVIHMRER